MEALMGNAALYALERAIKFESDGRDFYLRTAEAVTDPVAKMLFLSLAEDEKDHIRRVREIYEELKLKPGWPSVASMVARQAGVLDVFERESAKYDRAGKSDVDAVEALEKAAEMEQKGLAFYRERGSEASCDAEAKFYQNLVEEEVKHLEAIKLAIKELT
jgi:rubrerythrin